MITTLWTIGLILFVFSLMLIQISDLPSSFRSYHKWEARALTSMILAVLCFGIAMYLTGGSINQNYSRIYAVKSTPRNLAKLFSVG